MGLNLKDKKANMKTGEYAPIPDARYELKVSETKIKTASTGKVMVATTFDIISGKFSGRKIWNNFVMTDASAGFLVSFLSACGSELINSEDVTPEMIAKDIKGKTVSAWAETAKGTNGKPQTSIAKWKAIEGGASGGADVGETQVASGGKQALFE